MSRDQLTRAKHKRETVQLELDGCEWVATEDSILVPAQRSVVITIGIRLKSQRHGMSNNWRAAHGRSVQLRKRTARALILVPVPSITRHLLMTHPPSRIGFTRLAPRALDTDNLAAAFKPIRDQVCCWLAGDNSVDARADDGIRSGYSFSYHQQQQRAYGVRIELAP